MIPKFRAWHALDNRMYDVQSIDLFWGTVTVYFLIGEPGKLQIKQTRVLDMRDIKLMQFTGLRDKTGREIYRDDIVRYLHPAIGEYLVGVVTFQDGTFTVGRMWDDGVHAWTSIEVLARPNEWENGKLVVPIEVIGNIWENPDLVKEGGNA